MEKRIEHRYFFGFPPEMVWEYLTRSELIAQWLMDNDFQPVVGCDFQFRTRPLPAYDFDGTAHCKVLAIDPLKKLVYSWKGGPGDGRITLDTVVEWTLTAMDGGTELHLVHKGFKDPENMVIYPPMNQGWLKNIGKINEFLKAK